MKLLDSLKRRAKALKTETAALFLAIRRRDTPLAAKLLGGMTVAYALSPIDIIPDFIPILGYLDELILLPFLIALTIKLIPAAIMEECRVQAVDLWAGGKPKRWLYAIPILLLWVLIAVIIVIHII